MRAGVKLVPVVGGGGGAMGWARPLTGQIGHGPTDEKCQRSGGGGRWIPGAPGDNNLTNDCC